MRLSAFQKRILKLLEGKQEPVEISALSRVLRPDSAGGKAPLSFSVVLSRSLKNLQDKGLIARMGKFGGPDDKVELTPSGKELLAANQVWLVWFSNCEWFNKGKCVFDEYGGLRILPTKKSIPVKWHSSKLGLWAKDLALDRACRLYGVGIKPKDMYIVTAKSRSQALSLVKRGKVRSLAYGKRLTARLVLEALSR